MDDERRLTIVKEIKYWKENRLLPEHYCDYLIALYTEGEDLEESEKQDKQVFSTKGIERFRIGLLYFVLPFSFVVIYFTEIHLYLQLIILILLLSYSVWCVYFFKGKGRFHYHSSVIISLFLFLLLTLFFIDSFIQSMLVKVIGISIHFLIWIILGTYNKLGYLVFAGMFGIGFALIYYYL